MKDKQNRNQHWYFNRQISVSVIIQLVFLATLIVGTWVNLQNQLSLLQHDIASLLKSQIQFQHKIEQLTRSSVCYEYRLRAIEKYLPSADISKKENN